MKRNIERNKIIIDMIEMGFKPIHLESLTVNAVTFSSNKDFVIIKGVVFDDKEFIDALLDWLIKRDEMKIRKRGKKRYQKMVTSPCLFISERGPNLCSHSISVLLHRLRNKEKRPRSRECILHDVVTDLKMAYESSYYIYLNDVSYVYAYIHPISHKPFYVGKGVRSRFMQHLFGSHNIMMKNIIKHIFDKDMFPIIELIPCDSKKESKLLEKQLIVKYSEYLVNTQCLITDVSQTTLKLKTVI